MKKIGIIILAAGASTRLGKAKQLLKFRNKTLIVKTVESAINSNCSNIVVVLGSDAENIKSEIKNFPVQICVNHQWQSGMASSIKYGLESLNDNSDLEAILILLSDQPFIESEHINKLIETFEQKNKPIIASEYKNILGVPALFSEKMFNELLKIKGDKGAKQLIKKSDDLVEKVPIPEAEFDVDTIDDYQKLKELE